MVSGVGCSGWPWLLRRRRLGRQIGPVGPSASVDGERGGSYALVALSTHGRRLGMWVCRSEVMRVLSASVRLREEKEADLLRVKA